MDLSKIHEAKKAGYSDAEIADYLATSDPKIQAARDAGYKDAEIVSHLAGPGPSFGRRALDAVGDAASAVADFGKRAGEYRDTQMAKAISGIAGMPRATSDVVKWGADKLGVSDAIPYLPMIGPTVVAGSMLPTSEDIYQKIRMPNAQGTGPQTERSINPVIDAGVQGVLAGPVMGVGGRLGPLANFGGGAGSEAAGEIAQAIAPDWETPARILGAVIGGGTGVGAGKLATKGAQVARAGTAPFTEAGRDTLVSQTLNRIASNPEKALTNLDSFQAGREAFPDAVPGFRIDAGKASRDPGLMAAAETAPQGMRGPMVQDNNRLVTEALGRLGNGMNPQAFVAELGRLDAGAAARAQEALDALPRGADALTAGQAIRAALQARQEALTTARSNATDPLYAAARESETRVNPWELMTSTADAVAANKGEPQRIMETVRRYLFTPEGRPDRSARGMMATRDAVSDLQGNQNLGNFSQSLLQDVKGRINRALEVVPEERQARATFANMSRPLDAFSADRGAPNVARAIEQDRFGTTNMTAADKVPALFFRPGDAGGSTMREFLTANNGNRAAIDAMRSFIADKARGAPNVQAFLRQNQPAIAALDPSLIQQLESAAATRNISTGFRDSAAGRFLTNDLDAAVRSTLGAPDSVRRMQSLRMTVGGDQQAVRGLQRAVLDDFQRSASSRVAEGATVGEATVTANGASTWLEKNGAAAANVLTPEQLGALRDIARNLKDQAQIPPGRVGSPTFDRLATESLVGALISPRLADAPFLYPLKRTLGLVYGGANEATMQRLHEALMDPAVAKALMRKATPANAQLAEPVLRQITGAAAVPASKEQR